MTLLNLGRLAIATTNLDVSTAQGRAAAAVTVPRFSAALEDLGDLDAVVAKVLG